jgi:hypothetical protein
LGAESWWGGAAQPQARSASPSCAGGANQIFEVSLFGVIIVAGWRKNANLGLPVWTRVLRGGSWNNNQDNVRSASRNNNHPANRNNNNGFRVVCVVPQLVPCL